MGSPGNKVSQSPHTNGNKASTSAELEDIDLSDLGFEECKTEEEQLTQLKRIKSLPCPLAIKRILKRKLLSKKVEPLEGFQGWRTRRRLEQKQMAMSCRDFSYRLELWRGSFKEIEGHFGTGVVSYFVFLKWLFQLNLIIFSAVFLFVVIPQVSFVNQATEFTTPCTSTNSSLYEDLEWNGEIAGNCSAGYRSYLDLTSVNNNETNVAVGYLADFFQGTGFMEDTVLFYGFYSSLDLSVNIDLISNYFSSYNLPLAYLLVTLFYFVLSLILMVKQSAEGVKETIIADEDKVSQYSNKVFGTWDYALNDIRNVVLKKKSIFNEITQDLLEEKDRARRTSRTGCQIFGLWSLRIVINIFVLGALGGSGYLIYYMTQLSSEIINTWPQYYGWHTAVQFLIEFMPSLTITLLNIIVPTIFEKIVSGEDYTPSTEVMVTLFRTVFLRLASLGVLFATLYSEINCSTKDDCNVGSAPCQPLYCWETGIGQQLYKLVLTDFFVVLAVTLLVEFPRKLVVSKCDCKLSQIVGYQQFLIPKNVLDLVYSQTLCWLGAFFSPLIPGICVVQFFFKFYLKKLSLLSNFVPNSRPYRASRSNSLFIIVLLLSFVACCVPIVYVVAIMTPSKGCGPFRPYQAMYNVIAAAICDWPVGFQTFLSYITSATFNIPIIMMLCLAIYYMSKLNHIHKERVNLLKEQLHLEGRDKQYLVKKINELQGPDGKKQTVKDKQRITRNALLTHGRTTEPPPQPATQTKGPPKQPADSFQTIQEDKRETAIRLPEPASDTPPGTLNPPSNLYE